MKSRLFVLFLLVLLMLSLQACSAAPTAAPTATPAPTDTASPQPSATPKPSDTPTPPPPTATTTNTSTATQTNTPSQTPRPSFAGFKVDYAQVMPNSMQFGFSVPGIKENFKLVVNTSEFTCALNEKNPDKLYCTGAQFAQGQSLKLTFYSLSGSTTPVFETTFKVAYVKTPTSNPQTLAAGANKCPDRGKNVTGEIEYRKLGEGYCVVATCFDACGYYYSLNTCPSGTEHNGIYQFSGPPPVICK
jgi:hypothetical protein